MRDVSAIDQVNFAGAPVKTDIKLCAPPDGTPKAVRFLINWADHGAVIGQSRSVLLNLQVAGAGDQIKTIRSIHVDNRNSGITLVARFPDTGFQVEILPNEEKFVPVVTAQLQCEIYALNFVTATELTQVFLANVLPPVMSGGAPVPSPDVDVDVTVSATAKNSSDQDRTIVHADRILSRGIAVPNAAPADFVFNAPAGSVYFLIKEIVIKTRGVRSTTASSEGYLRASLYNATTGGEVVGVNSQAVHPGGSFGYDHYTNANGLIELHLTNLRLALDLTRTFQLRWETVVGNAAGGVEMYLAGGYAPL